MEWGQNVYGIGDNGMGWNRKCMRGNETLSYLTDTLVLLQNVVSENRRVEFNYGGQDIHSGAHYIRILIVLGNKTSITPHHVTHKSSLAKHIPTSGKWNGP